MGRQVRKELRRLLHEALDDRRVVAHRRVQAPSRQGQGGTVPGEGEHLVAEPGFPAPLQGLGGHGQMHKGIGREKGVLPGVAGRGAEAFHRIAEEILQDPPGRCQGARGVRRIFHHQAGQKQGCGPDQCLIRTDRPLGQNAHPQGQIGLLHALDKQGVLQAHPVKV